MAHPWREIRFKRDAAPAEKDRQGDDTSPPTTEQVEARRNDPEFKARLDRIMDEDREVIDRLADA